MLLPCKTLWGSKALTRTTYVVFQKSHWLRFLACGPAQSNNILCKVFYSLVVNNNWSVARWIVMCNLVLGLTPMLHKASWVIVLLMICNCIGNCIKMLDSHIRHFSTSLHTKICFYKAYINHCFSMSARGGLQQCNKVDAFDQLVCKNLTYPVHLSRC